jgi:hypothetical protein
MLFTYIDETGNSGAKKSEDQPIHLLGALVIDANQVRVVEDAMDEIARRYGDPNAVEFKGYDLYQRTGSFKGFEVASCITVTEELIDLAVRNATTFGYAGVDKRKSNARDHPQVIAITFLLERLQPFLRSRKEQALIVADEYNELGDTLIEEYERFKKTGTSWGYAKVRLANVCDSLHYVKSKHSRMLQLCDVLTYITSKYLQVRERIELPSDEEVPWHEREKERLARASRAERATLALWERFTLTRFRAKIFP